MLATPTPDTFSASVRKSSLKRPSRPPAGWRGRYAIVSPLRTDGPVRVVAVRDRRLGRELMLRNLASGSGATATRRFRREVWLGARLSHPGLLPVYDCGTDPHGDLRWLVTEQLRGSDLDSGIAKRRAQGKRLKEVFVLSLFRELLRTLDYLHRAGVVHTDVRPRNIWVVRDPNTGSVQHKLVGLGNAWRSGEEVGDRARCIDRRYAAPEQCVDGQIFDARADLYAVGVCLYEALTGEHPHFFGFERRPFVPPSAQLPATLPREFLRRLDALIDRALALEPSGRFTDAREMEDAVTRVLVELERPV